MYDAWSLLVNECDKAGFRIVAFLSPARRPLTIRHVAVTWLATVKAHIPSACCGSSEGRHCGARSDGLGAGGDPLQQRQMEPEPELIHFAGTACADYRWLAQASAGLPRLGYIWPLVASIRLGRLDHPTCR